MTKPFTICVGTLSSGIFRSTDAGETWVQAPLEMPLPPWSPWIEVRAITVSPHDPMDFLAGSNVGLHRSRDGGKTWSFIRSPADGMQVWTTAFHPKQPERLYAGLAPFETGKSLIRSDDGGATWKVLPLPLPARSVVGATHLTSLAFDPHNPNIVWASAELAGLFRSPDNGDTWTPLPPFGEVMTNQDIHCVQIHPNGRILATTPDGIWTSADNGQHFTLYRFPPFAERDPPAIASNITGYSRAVMLKPDDANIILVGTGDYTPGRFGAVQRSTDGGKTWAAAAQSHPANSHFYWIAFNRAETDTVVAVTMLGYLYVSRDAGASWTKVKREFGEVRGLAVTP